jgi:hypothetical protein
MQLKLRVQVKITRKTFTALDLQRINPRSPGYWNKMTMDGYHLIDIDDQVADELRKSGVDLDNPLSIEDFVLKTIKNIFN